MNFSDFFLGLSWYKFAPVFLKKKILSEGEKSLSEGEKDILL